jgi:hypothetical protein
MAIVLVVIGLVLGMVYKGRQLIDQSKVKKLVANRNKIIAAVNTYYDRYGLIPGDGCTSPEPGNPRDCDPDTTTGDNEHPGLVERGTEDAAFWYLLTQKTGILQESAQTSVFGQKWEIISQQELNDHWPGSSYEFGSYMNLEGGDQADPRIGCAVDKLVDNGNSTSGGVFTETKEYDKSTNCWDLSGQMNIVLKILP